MSNESWPPEFSLDQEKILSLLTGDRFYSNPSAALREAVLNAIDAVQRRREISPDIAPEIRVTFSRDDLKLTVADNGIGMSQAEVTDLFAKVGASAATNEAKKKSVGEFGIGVISYFMAGNVFTCTAPGFLDTRLRYAAWRSSYCSRASSGVRYASFSRRQHWL